VDRTLFEKGVGAILCCFQCSFLLLDPCALTATTTLVVQFGATYTTGFVQDDRVDVRGVDREKTLNANAVGDLPYSKGGSCALALQLDHVSTERLDPFLVSFNDFIVDSDVITGFKLGEVFFARKLFVDEGNGSVHNSKFREAKVGRKPGLSKF